MNRYTDRYIVLTIHSLQAECDKVTECLYWNWSIQGPDNNWRWACELLKSSTGSGNLLYWISGTRNCIVRKPRKEKIPK